DVGEPSRASSFARGRLPQRDRRVVERAHPSAGARRPNGGDGSRGGATPGRKNGNTKNDERHLPPCETRSLRLLPFDLATCVPLPVRLRERALGMFAACGAT